MSAFVLTSEYSFVKAKNEVVARVVNTYENIVKIYEVSQNGDNSYIASKVIGYKNYKYPNAKNYGPRDLDLEKKPNLVKVKGQKLKLTENLYKVRFIDSK